MNTTEKTESVKKEWYENFEEREYKGVKYKIYAVTPACVEDKIKAFIDRIEQRQISCQLFGVCLSDCEVITEGSEAVLFDVWFFKFGKFGFISDAEIIPQDKPDFIIARHKHNKKGKYGYRIRYGL